MKTYGTKLVAGHRTLWAMQMFLVASLLATTAAAFDNAKIYPAADPSLLSPLYRMQVEGRDVPVYKLRVAPEDRERRSAAMDNKAQTGDFFEEAAFAYFDMAGGVDVSVTFASPITAARLLPVGLRIPLSVRGNTVHFSMAEPQNLTLEVNNQLVRTLHIFASPMETDAPSPKDPNVLYFSPGAHQVNNLQVPAGKTIFYFGPGMHTIDNLTVRDGQTVYIAGGAVVRAVIRAGEPSSIFQRPGAQAETKYRQPTIDVHGSHIQIRGRGVLDGSQTLGKFLMRIEGQELSLEGIILQDSGTWNMPLQYSDHVSITNLKILGYRANSDGIDIKSSRDVTVKGCFVRVLDDLIVVKTVLRDAKAPADTDKADHVLVQGNILWNEVGHALSIGAEVQADVSNVEFMDNDVIHDLGREWPLRIYLSGSGNVSTTHFQNIRIDRTGNQYVQGPISNLIYLSIINSSWRADSAQPLGKIDVTIFRNIQAVLSKQGQPPLKAQIKLVGANEQSDIEGVLFDNIVINGQRLSRSNSAIVERFATKVTGLPR